MFFYVPTESCRTNPPKINKNNKLINERKLKIEEIQEKKALEESLKDPWD